MRVVNHQTCTALAAALFCVAVDSSLAFTPAPDCVVTRTGSVYAFGAGPDTNYWITDPEVVGSEIVLWNYMTFADDSGVVLRDCSSGDELNLVIPQDAEDAVWMRFEALVYGEAAYSLRAIRDEMEALGASGRLSNGSLGTCVCDAAGFESIG